MLSLVFTTVLQGKKNDDKYIAGPLEAQTDTQSNSLLPHTPILSNTRFYFIQLAINSKLQSGRSASVTNDV